MPVVKMVIRLLLTVTVLLVIYYQMPINDTGEGSDVIWLCLDLVLFSAVVAAQVPLILRARYPVLRAAQSMALSVCLYLMVFARLYVSIAATNPAAFSERVDRSTSLYFTVTVFATVGFGDITPDTNPVRLLVTFQMILNLVMIGVVVRLLLTLGQRSRDRRGPS